MTLSPHVRSQLSRFARLFIVALLAQVAVIPREQIGWSVLASAILAAAETAFRQVNKVAAVPETPQADTQTLLQPPVAAVEPSNVTVVPSDAQQPPTSP